mgnify:CR=1 FL=1
MQVINKSVAKQFTATELAAILEVIETVAQDGPEAVQEWADNGWEDLARLPCINDDTNRLEFALAIVGWA